MLSQLSEDTIGEFAEAFVGAPGRRVAAVALTSIDGACSYEGVSAPLASPTDKKLLQYLRRRADAVVVGAATAYAERYVGFVRTTEEEGQARRANGQLPSPLLFVLSRSLDIPAGANLFRRRTSALHILTKCPEGPNTRWVSNFETLTANGVSIFKLSELNPASILDFLSGRGLSKILIEGGPTIFSQWVNSRLFDDLFLTVSPFLVGKGQPTFPLSSAATLSHQPLRLGSAAIGDSHVFLRYERPGTR